MNQAVFVGRICRDISIRTVNESHRVTNNTIAINRAHRDRNGEVVTDYIPFVAWDHLADVLQTYTKKGSMVSLSGMMQSRNYTNKESQTIYVVECLVTDVTLIDRKTRTSENTQQIASEQRPVAKETQAV